MMDKLKECKKLECNSGCCKNINCNAEKYIGGYSLNTMYLDNNNILFTKSALEKDIYAILNNDRKW